MIVYGAYKEGQIVYIGQTTQTLESRIKGHIDSSKYQKQKYPFAQAIHDFGIEAFEFKVLYEGETLEDINRMEQYYIKRFKTQEQGYNVRKGGDNRYHSDATKEKISQAQQGELNHMYGIKGSQHPSSKPVINLVTGDTYTSAQECADSEGVSISKVAEVCRGIKDGLYGMVYRYIDAEGYIIHIPNEELPKNKIVYNKSTNRLYGSLTDASIDLGYGKSYLSTYIKRNNFKGRSFTVDDNKLIILQ